MKKKIIITIITFMLITIFSIWFFGLNYYLKKENGYEIFYGNYKGPQDRIHLSVKLYNYWEDKNERKNFYVYFKDKNMVGFYQPTIGKPQTPYVRSIEDKNGVTYIYIDYYEYSPYEKLIINYSKLFGDIDMTKTDSTPFGIILKFNKPLGNKIKLIDESGLKYTEVFENDFNNYKN